MDNDSAEHVAFVHQVRETIGVLLFAKLRARIFAFQFQLPGSGCAQSFQPLFVDNSWEYEIAFVLQLPNLFLGHNEEHCNPAFYFLRSRRRRSSAVTSRWQRRQSVRMFSRSHSPPPSTTGTT